MDFLVTVHKQVTEVVSVTDAADAEQAITIVRAGTGTVVSSKIVSVQYVPLQQAS